MLDKSITTNETGDTSLKELCEQRGYLLTKIIDNLQGEYPSDKIDATLKEFLEKTEELIKQFKLK